jgi:hypothetical protein
MTEKKLKKNISSFFIKKTCQPLTKDFGPEILYLKKQWSSIPDQLNIHWWHWKKNSNHTKGFKTKGMN